ncbi:hypothetical protein AB4874_16000 [Thioclava sp. 15-R06ZXC-3]|uniref:Uncharacterized protein n=1 Tax=Thioclava arctica TaxID=3238301 RepID=A0ABV3TPB7_9RHOB
MSFDILFCRNQEDVLDLKNHTDFLALFDADIGGRVYGGYDDFYVTDQTLAIADARLALALTSAGIGSHEVPSEIPDGFCDIDARTAHWSYLLRCYPALLEMLRENIRDHGPLVCAYG